MILKKLNPVTNGTRHQFNLRKNLLAKKNGIVKNLIKNLKLNHGRSSFTGHITVRHKGGGCKKKMHVLNSSFNSHALTICQFYSSSHNSFVSLNFELKKFFFFKTISTYNLYPGSLTLNQNTIKDFFIGYRTQLQFFPIGSIIHSISSKNRILYGRSAGVFCQIIERTIRTKVRLPSGNIIYLSNDCFATLGMVANSKFNQIVIGKSGRNRLKGKRPSVRGIAMNPVDHPHGGRTNGGRPSVTPWGIPTKGKPTVKKKL